MHPTSRLLAKGLTQRSVAEFQAWWKLASGDALRYQFDPLPLVDFSDPDTINDCKTMSDQELGGQSTSNLDFVPATATEPAHARFHGSISRALPADDLSVHSCGFAGWRNKDRKWTIFGKPIWNLEPFPYLALRVKSDQRKYFVNMQTETIVPTDIHQHRLRVRHPGEWETIFLQFRSFVRTNYGHVIEPQNEMLRMKTKSVGFSSIDRVEGPFDIRIYKIWAALRMEDAGMLDDGRPLPTDRDRVIE